MKNNPYFKFLILVIIPVFLFVNCNKDNCNDEPEQKIITIGALVPLTGQAASVGESSVIALSLAIDDINQYLNSLGSGKSLNVLVEDTETDTTVALQKLKELHNKGVQVVIGPYTSSSTKSVKNYANQNGIVIISPASVATSLSIPNDNIFRLVPALNTQAEALVVLLEDDGIEVLAPIVRDDIWGNDLLDAVSQVFSKSRGGTVLEPVMYDPATADFSPFAGQLELNVQQALEQYDTAKVGTYMISFSEGTEIINSVLESQPLKQINWYGTSGYAENKFLPLDLSAAAFAALQGLMCPTYGFDPSAKEIWQPLVDRIYNEIGRAPEIYALVTYDALWLTVMTYLKSDQPVSVDKYKDLFVHECDNYFGSTGWTRLNEAGDREYATYDFWGIVMFLNAFEWQIRARYDNATGVLTRY
jgi:branched-chain amino acid transport system substrate-binding protein